VTERCVSAPRDSERAMSDSERATRSRRRSLCSHRVCGLCSHRVCAPTCCSFEAGHYLDTLGYVSFDIPTPGDPVAFEYEFVDANMEALYNFTGVPAASFQTPLGESITEAISDTVEKLGLKEVLGCPTEEYTYSSSLGAPHSLYTLYLDTILPNAVNSVATGTGTCNAEQTHLRASCAVANSCANPLFTPPPTLLTHVRGSFTHPHARFARRQRHLPPH